MMQGPFMELYASARVREVETCTRGQAPVRRTNAPAWKQRLARTLVRLATGLDHEQARVELPAAPAQHLA